MKTIQASELPLYEEEGAVYHLRLRPEQIADKILLVGDPARVDLVASMFDEREFQVDHREFRTVTGLYKGKRVTVLSTGMGTDNIDIVMNELDALANVDLSTRTIREQFRQLTLVRVGTSGGLQPHVPIGTYVIAQKSIGFDGVLNFYAGRDEVCDLEFERAFVQGVAFSPRHAAPYVVAADEELVERIGGGEMVNGVTIAANGFFGPQGRVVRLPLDDPKLNEKIEQFEFRGQKITNFEMESSSLAGLSRLMGHKAMTVCCIIANRRSKGINLDYNQAIRDLLTKVLDRI